MSVLSIDLPDGLLAANALSAEEAVREARLLLAAKWFEMGRISGGRAAELAGMSRAELMFELSRLGVSPIQLDADEIEKEFGEATAGARLSSERDTSQPAGARRRP